jgi:transposase
VGPRRAAIRKSDLSFLTIIRHDHSRCHSPHGSDLTDAEREILAPLLPPDKIGGPCAGRCREIMNTIFYAMVDPNGRALALQARPLSTQDRDRLVPLLKVSRAARARRRGNKHRQRVRP